MNQINPIDEQQKPSKLETALKYAGLGLDLAGMGAKVADLKQGREKLELMKKAGGGIK